MPARPAHETRPTKRFLQRLRSVCMVPARAPPALLAPIPILLSLPPPSPLGELRKLPLGEWRAREPCTCEHRLHSGWGNTRHRSVAERSHTPRPMCKTCSGHRHRQPHIACPFHIAGRVVGRMSRSRRNDRGRKTHRRTRYRTCTLDWVRSSTKLAQDNHPRWPCPPARASSLDIAHKLRSSTGGASKPPAAASPTATKDAVHCRSKAAVLRSLAVR